MRKLVIVVLFAALGARAEATLQGYLKSGLGIVEAVEKTNHRLSTRNDANMFVTAWIGIVDLTNGAEQADDITLLAFKLVSLVS